MRSFLINGYEIKKLCCLFFSGEVIVYTCVAPFIGQYSISLSLIWQMAVISIIMTILQYVIYTFDFMCKVPRIIKVSIHYLLLVGIGYLFASLFKWFDLSNVKYVLVALAIFTVSFVATVGSIGLYTKLTGEEFNEKLKVYKELKSRNEV